MCAHDKHTRICTHPPPDETSHTIRYLYSHLHKLLPRPHTHLPAFKSAHVYTCTHDTLIRMHDHSHGCADTCTQLSIPYTRCVYVHTCTPSPRTNTNTFIDTKGLRTRSHTRKHEGSGGSQARVRVHTDHGPSTAVCPSVMPAACHQGVASEMARCPAKIRWGQPCSWHLLCRVCPEEQPRCPAGGLAPHSGTRHSGACGLFPQRVCRGGGGRARARAGDMPGCVPEFTYPLGKLFTDGRGSQSRGRGHSANSQTQRCLPPQGFPPPELRTYRATWTCWAQSWARS